VKVKDERIFLQHMSLAPPLKDYRVSAANVLGVK
jgi:hypothetical protein